MILDQIQRQILLEKYQNLFPVPELGYGTVRDYCDSCDVIPFLSNRQGDLKDFQRPWMVKAILGTCRPGSRILEIGAGEPIVAQTLAELGYQVTVVDPYDGSGRGPTEYEEFRRVYPDVTILRKSFSAEVVELAQRYLDCIYSISVLEHVTGPPLQRLFEGIRTFLKPGGCSLHSIDHVVGGRDTEPHTRNLIDILNYQSELRRSPASGADASLQLESLTESLIRDVDTYYLSASGHNLWRGTMKYDDFPFRKVVSILSSARLVEACVHPYEASRTEPPHL